MIKTKLTREDAVKIIELGRQLHSESRFKETSFNVDKCWAVLDATVTHPEKFFIAYDDAFAGFILMTIQEHYWTKDIWAGDLAFYVSPNKRGSSLAVKLLHEACSWAKQNNATEITILHNTGIDTDAGTNFLNRCGYKTVGSILTKDL